MILAAPCLAQTDSTGRSGFQTFFIDGGPLAWVLLALSLVTVKLAVGQLMAVRRSTLMAGEAMCRPAASISRPVMSRPRRQC